MQHSQEAQDVQCSVCGLWFGSQELTGLHIRIVHPGTVETTRSRKRTYRSLFRAIGRLAILVTSPRRLSSSSSAQRGTPVVALPSSPKPRAAHPSVPPPPPRYSAGVYWVRALRSSFSAVINRYWSSSIELTEDFGPTDNSPLR